MGKRRGYKKKKTIDRAWTIHYRVAAWHGMACLCLIHKGSPPRHCSTRRQENRLLQQSISQSKQILSKGPP
ncbi:hypothetical protein TGAM01_v207955 [Trichoderma gamsii]|uniref:Uncharacterized protein n=1 Tax=Trichoderma gamsii TaxID=398673 RepID=A0A2P4ZFY4_9HYPO|nr:hypothetical protein TGAM01_v207955 [Trichoderma gamsii]PON23182.1 hypothetical protein TGAM01_v207955 [Trichoderma gamsii]